MKGQKNTAKDAAIKIAKDMHNYVVYEEKVYAKNSTKKINLNYFTSVIEALGEIYRRIRDKNLFTTDGMWKAESEDRLAELIKKSEEKMKEYIEGIKKNEIFKTKWIMWIISNQKK